VRVVHVQLDTMEQVLDLSRLSRCCVDQISVMIVMFLVVVVE